MRRMTIVVGIAAALVLALAGHGHAKGLGGGGKILIDGPGLAAPIEFRTTRSLEGNSAFWGFLGDSGLFQDTKASPPTGVKLGPRYEVMVFMAPRPGAIPVLYRMDLYPYASDGPWTHTEAQSTRRFFPEVREGWWAAPPGLTVILEQHGLPANPPPPASSGTATLERSPTGFPWVWVAASGLLLMVVAGAVVARPRARPA